MKLTSRLGSQSWKFLSVPTLNNINNEEFVEGNALNITIQCNNSNSKKSNKKSIASGSISLIRSSFNEKSESVLSVASNLEKTRRKSDFGLPNKHNGLFGSNQFINKYESDDITQLKTVSSSMTQAYSESRGPADPDGSAGAPLQTKNFDTAELIQNSRLSKARQKKFHRHFKQVDIEEKVLNYYSCALVGDILLQGHLYITENFFAFYSNVFGYVTKLLIPMVDVSKITKEKTAKIIPNAVGISTEDEKHVFGSLLSRDSTYKFMSQVWKAANSSNPVVNITPPPIIKTVLPSEEDSSGSSVNEEPSTYITNLTTNASSENFQSLLPTMKRKSLMLTAVDNKNSKEYWKSFKVTTILAISVALLAFLFVSAGYLLYRIAIIQNHFNDLSFTPKGTDVYEDILKWQSSLHSTSANKMYEFLNTNLNQIIKIRLSLEALSMLLLPRNNKSDKHNQHPSWMSPNIKEDNEGTTVDENVNN